MSKDTEFEKLQDEAIKLIKNKKGKVMETPKVYTLGQIIKTIILIVVLLTVGALAGITIDRAINKSINDQVKIQTVEQVKSFTEAVQ